jgi:hypothetical protein
MDRHTKSKEERLADLRKVLAKLQKELRRTNGHKREIIIDEIRGVCREIEKTQNS